jgi:hypothetical protein
MISEEWEQYLPAAGLARETGRGLKDATPSTAGEIHSLEYADCTSPRDKKMLECFCIIFGVCCRRL